MNTRSKISLGKLGEDIACAYLEGRGDTILVRYYRRHRSGEIDINADIAGTICFIEVKTRTSERYGKPAEAVTLAKQRKIYRCAEYYLQMEKLIDCMPLVSFDVVSIIIEGTAVKSLEHFPHCF